MAGHEISVVKTICYWETYKVISQIPKRLSRRGFQNCPWRYDKNSLFLWQK